jgi:hypothetical protein
MRLLKYVGGCFCIPSTMFEGSEEVCNAQEGRSQLPPTSSGVTGGLSSDAGWLAGGSSCYIHLCGDSSNRSNLVVVVQFSIEMRPLILVAASALAVAAAWAVINFRARRERVAHHLLPRYFLLTALYERLPELTSTYVNKAEWESFSLEILRCLVEIRDAAGGMSLNDQEEPQAVQTESGSPNGQELLHPASNWNVERSVLRVSDAVDSCLLPYLQSQEEVAMLLRDYLPKPKQSWKAFIDTKLEDSEKTFFGLNQYHANIDDELEALKACGSLVIQFISEIRNVSNVTEDATRGRDIGCTTTARGRVMGCMMTARGRVRGWTMTARGSVIGRTLTTSAVPPDGLRKQDLESCTEVKVFYATDRKITKDGEYVGKRSVSRGLHYGLMVVGIPNVHRPGFMEAPTRNSEEANPRKHVTPRKHVVILSIDTTLRGDTTGFIQKINQELDQACCTSSFTNFPISSLQQKCSPCSSSCHVFVLLQKWEQ